MRIRRHAHQSGPIRDDLGIAPDQRAVPRHACA